MEQTQETIAPQDNNEIPLDQLPETDVRPEFLRTRIKEILENKGVLHIVNDER